MSEAATETVRVLVAEDETIIRLDLKGLLESAGFEVCAEARDGEEAVRLARETSPDVALLDVKMPGSTASRRRGGCSKSARSPSSW